MQCNAMQCAIRAARMAEKGVHFWWNKKKKEKNEPKKKGKARNGMWNVMSFMVAWFNDRRQYYILAESSAAHTFFETFREREEYDDSTW